MNILIHKNYISRNFDNRPKNIKIKYVIIHYTETRSFNEALKLLTSETRKVSCHYVLDLDGKVYNLVDESKRAWHAGISYWNNKENLNDNSIGIELVNEGEEKKKRFTKKQISSLLNILKFLKKKYNIRTQDFLGHSDIAPQRKIDPGIYFPWKLLSESSFGLWVNIKNKNYDFCKSLEKKDEKKFLENLMEIGYFVDSKNFCIRNENNIKTINSFHRHFLPDNLHNSPSRNSLHVSEILKKLIHQK